MVNKVQGKGFEDERNYDNLKFHFFDIENIHVMRSSQQKLLDGRICLLFLGEREIFQPVQGQKQ